MPWGQLGWVPYWFCICLYIFYHYYFHQNGFRVFSQSISLAFLLMLFPFGMEERLLGSICHLFSGLHNPNSWQLLTWELRNRVTKGEGRFVSKEQSLLHLYIVLFLFKQSILWHGLGNTEWDHHTPAGCSRAGGAVATSCAYAAGVCSLEGHGETSTTKMLLQEHLAAKLVLQKYWDSCALFLHLSINVFLLYLLFLRWG